MNQQLRDAYWGLVRECLTRFHGLSEAEAERLVAEMLRDMENAPEGIDTDVVFTTEAFDLASELAGRDLELRPVLNEYLAMVNRHYAHIPVPAPARDRPPGFLPAA